MASDYPVANVRKEADDIVVLDRGTQLLGKNHQAVLIQSTTQSVHLRQE